MNSSLPVENQEPIHTSALHRSVRVAVISALLMLIPFTFSLFSEEMDWSPFDYILIWTLLFFTGLTYSFITRNSIDTIYRLAVGLAVVSGLMLTWANLAVGLIGSEDNPINLSYMFILALGILVSFFVRFKAMMMTIIMVTMAFLLLVVGVVALFMDMHLLPHSSVTQIIGVTGFFMLPMLVSAILFYQAHIDQQKASQF
jgi:hypothetical protein